MLSTQCACGTFKHRWDYVDAYFSPVSDNTYTDPLMPLVIYSSNFNFCSFFFLLVVALCERRDAQFARTLCSTIVFRQRLLIAHRINELDLDTCDVRERFAPYSMCTSTHTTCLTTNTRNTLSPQMDDAIDRIRRCDIRIFAYCIDHER